VDVAAPFGRGPVCVSAAAAHKLLHLLLLLLPAATRQPCADNLAESEDGWHFTERQLESMAISTGAYQGCAT